MHSPYDEPLDEPDGPRPPGSDQRARWAWAGGAAAAVIAVAAIAGVVAGRHRSAADALPASPSASPSGSLSASSSPYGASPSPSPSPATTSATPVSASPSATSATPSPTTASPTTTTPAATSTTPAPATSTSAPTTDGDFGYVVDVTTKGNHRAIVFDRALLLTGDAANTYAAKHGMETPPPDDYVIVNDNKLLRTFVVAPDAQVLGTGLLSGTSTPTPSSLDALTDWLSAHGGSGGLPVRLTYDATGHVTRIVEVFFP